MGRHTELPEGFHLLENEELVSVESFEASKPSISSSTLQEIYRLTSASTDSEVGIKGPALAALSYLREDSDDKPEHQGLYEAVFGRDSLRVAIDLVSHYPALARSTIMKMAEYQGVTSHKAREEEPGRIVHEIRDPNDPIAKRITEQRGWEWPYYGSVDATPEFIRTISAYCRLSDDNMRLLLEEYTDRKGKKQQLFKSLQRAVDWITKRMDSNKEGLLEYKAAIPKGIENQVWKDSWDSYHHADGTLANHDKGIASIEVQAVTYDALLEAAELFIHFGKVRKAGELLKRAEKLREAVMKYFWTDDDGGYFVLGTDRDDKGRLRQLKVKTSNMGHVLYSRLLDEDTPDNINKRLAIFNQLHSPELLAVSGIRTLASDEVRYREGAYHNGSVWIWDTHHIAKGLRRYGRDPIFTEFADDLDERIINVCETIGGFPEYVRGGDRIETNTRAIEVYDRSVGRMNRVEQPPQEVQAWTVAAILATKIRRGRRRTIG